MSHLFNLSGFALLSRIAALLVLRKRSQRWAWRALMAVILGYAAMGTYVLPYIVSRLLVRGYAPLLAPTDVSGRTAIVLLGAGQIPIGAWDGTFALMLHPSAVARVAEARRVFGLYPDAVIISSGGATIEANSPTRAEVIRTILIDMGVPSARILLEDRSSSTRDEAVLIKPMLASIGASRVVLVTSDIHMWRSMSSFRATGIEAVQLLPATRLCVSAGESGRSRRGRGCGSRAPCPTRWRGSCTTGCAAG